MKDFKRHQRDVDVKPILSEVLLNETAWIEQTGRQRRVAVQAETNSIPIRGLRRSKIMGRRRRDVQETRYTSLAKRFPDTVALLERLASGLGGRLGRAKFARLPPDAKVLPHVDRGEYYELRDRYHLVVESNGESVLKANDEEVRMKTGELWWFNNKAVHSAHNDSKIARIHLVFDLQPQDHAAKKIPKAELPDPCRILQDSLGSKPLKARHAVAEAVELYLAVKQNPERWQELLEDQGCAERAQSAPIGILAELLWPALESGRRRRRESAIGWALAQLDLGRLEAREIASALQEAGGIRAVHDVWRTSKDESLYGTR